MLKVILAKIGISLFRYLLLEQIVAKMALVRTGELKSTRYHLDL